VLTVVVGERTFEAGPETLVWLPRGVLLGARFGVSVVGPPLDM